MSGPEHPEHPEHPDDPASPASRRGPKPRPGRRALFSGPYNPGLVTGARDDARPGRQAFFSDFSEPVHDGEPGHRGGPRDAGREVHPGLTTVVLECRTCRQRTPMSLAGLGLSLIPSLWLPTRPWPRLMRCPACRRVSWCRIEWPRPGG